MTQFNVGDRVEGGKYGTEDYDTGRVVAVDVDTVTVGWDTGVQTTVSADGPYHEVCHETLRPEGTSAKKLSFTISGRSVCFLRAETPETMWAARTVARMLSRRIKAPVEIYSSDGITLDCVEAY